jgi:hypothetical protein
VGPALDQTSSASRIEGEGGGCLVGAGRRKHQGEIVKGEDGDATSDLLLKHSDATFATYV